MGLAVMLRSGRGSDYGMLDSPCYLDLEGRAKF